MGGQKFNDVFITNDEAVNFLKGEQGPQPKGDRFLKLRLAMQAWARADSLVSHSL
jgi:hypothetical protein